jgi:hypothetical protein
VVLSGGRGSDQRGKHKNRSLKHHQTFTSFNQKKMIRPKRSGKFIASPDEKVRLWIRSQIDTSAGVRRRFSQLQAERSSICQ